MSNHVSLCVDAESLKHPEMIGLGDESLESQPWLTVYCDAVEARSELNEPDNLDDVLVVSSDSVEGINLAAAIKGDNSQRQVSFVSFDGSGSVMGRAEAAGLDLVLGMAEFQRRYALCKKRGTKGDQAPSAAPDAASVVPSEDGRGITGLPIEEGELSGAGRRFHLAKAPAKAAPLVPERKDPHVDALRLPSTESMAERIANASFSKVNVENNAFVVAVVSGSGGCGKSTLAASMAVFYQMTGRKTLLLDADLQFGDAQYLIGREASLNVIDLMADPRRIDALEPEGAMPALLASPARLEQSELIMDRMAEMIEFLKGYFDVIVVNTGAFWSEQHAQILESADKSIFLIDQRPSSLRACSHALDLCSRCGIATQSFVFALNFCSRQALFTSLDVSCNLHGAKVEEISDGGREVAELLGAGMSVDLLASKNPFAKSVRDICAKVLSLPEDSLTADPELVPLASSKQGWFSGFRKRRAACL